MSNSEKKEQEENLKKAWIEPEMEEIQVAGGKSVLIVETFAGTKS